MRKHKLTGTVVIVALLTFLMVMPGCVKQENPNLKTYQEYVKSLLDVNYLGDYEMYEQISGSNNGEDIHNECVADIADTLAASFAIEEDMLSADMLARLDSVSKELCSKASYTVDEAVYSDNIYTVNVKVKSLNYLETAKAAFDTYIDDFNNRAANGEFLDMTEGEYETRYAEGVIELLETSLDECSYGEESSYIVTIQVNENGESYVSDDDLSRVGALIFPNYH